MHDTLRCHSYIIELIYIYIHLKWAKSSLLQELERIYNLMDILKVWTMAISAPVSTGKKDQNLDDF